jgi:hypothetical protein
MAGIFSLTNFFILIPESGYFSISSYVGRVILDFELFHNDISIKIANQQSSQ